MESHFYTAQIVCDLSELDLIRELAQAFGALSVRDYIDEDYYDVGIPDVRSIAKFQHFDQALTYSNVAARFQAKTERWTCLTSYFPSKSLLDKDADNIASLKGIYLIEAIDSDGIYKIGLSTNLAKRLKTLQTGCPFELQVKFFIPCPTDDVMKKLERELHSVFSSKRMSGEWFRLMDADLKMLQTHFPCQLIGGES